MNKLIQAFLWTCTAIFLGLVVILVMSAAKGHFHRDTVTRIVALLNGIDIQGERLKQALQEGRTVPVSAPVENNEPKSLSILQADSRSASLDRYKKELDDRAQRLKEATERHNALVAEFKRTMDQASKTKATESMQQIKEILEALDPAAAKVQLVTMLDKEQKEEVLSILKELDADKLKKILGEFVDLADQEKIAEILEEIRVRGKLISAPPNET